MTAFISSRSRLLFSCSLILIVVCCSSPERQHFETSADWKAVQTTVGTERSVHTLTGSIWRGTAHLEPELTIGAEDKGEQYVFGQVMGAVLGDDCILVLDASIPALRKYSLSGEYVRDVARQGGGPGEFLRPYFPAVHPTDGRIFIQDRSLARVNIYSPAGEYLDAWRVPANYLFGTPPVISDDGFFYHNRSLAGPYPMPDVPTGMVGFGPEGAIGDTISSEPYSVDTPSLVGYREDGGMFASMAIPFYPDFHWILTPSRSLVTGYAEDYLFRVHSPGGGITRVSREWTPIAVQQDEANWYREALLVFFRSFKSDWRWDGPEIPSTKPAYEMFFADLDSRIWVIRPGEGRQVEGCPNPPMERMDLFDNPCWKDERLVDVFDSDGKYLGPVMTPDGFSFMPQPYVKGEHVVGVVVAKDGTQRVVKYRLILPQR